MIILGLGTRYAAGLITIFVIIATAISHRYWELAEPARRLQQVQFYKNLAITGGALFLFICAAGRFCSIRNDEEAISAYRFALVVPKNETAACPLSVVRDRRIKPRRRPLSVVGPIGGHYQLSVRRTGVSPTQLKRSRLFDPRTVHCPEFVVAGG